MLSSSMRRTIFQGLGPAGGLLVMGGGCVCTVRWSAYDDRGGGLV